MPGMHAAAEHRSPDVHGSPSLHGSVFGAPGWQEPPLHTSGLVPVYPASEQMSIPFDYMVTGSYSLRIHVK